MKRYLFLALIVLTVTPGAVLAQMMGGGMSGDAPPPPPSRQEMKPQMQAPGVNIGMMGPGTMSGMMGQGKDMMGGCMMAGGMTGSMMPAMMDGMMSGQTRGCMMMAEGMLKGQIDLAQMRKALTLSDEQVERLRAGLRPFQKEAILALASLKVEELDLADLLAGEKVDFGKVEAKLKQIEGMRTKARLTQIKATAAVQGILSEEQLEKLQGTGENIPPPPAPVAPQKGVTPQTDSEHERHH